MVHRIPRPRRKLYGTTDSCLDPEQTVFRDTCWYLDQPGSRDHLLRKVFERTIGCAFARNDHTVHGGRAPSPPPHDPIEPDPMNPVQAPPDSKPAERPDLDWAEHED